MGRKTSPKILRIGNVTRSWDGRWFTGRKSDYRQNLLRDIKIRDYFSKKMKAASVSRVEIERGPASGGKEQETVLTVHTSRPAMVIGRGGSGISIIQNDLKRIMGGKVKFRVNVQEIRNPDTEANAVATQVVEQLERRFSFRRVLKQAVARSVQAGAQGVRVEVSGRLNGADIARKEWLAEGNVPLHTFRSDISFAEKTAITTYGTIGVKVWINRGELSLDEGDEEKKVDRKPMPVLKRQSLAEKASRTVRVKSSENRTENK